MKKLEVSCVHACWKHPINKACRRAKLWTFDHLGVSATDGDRA
ncbi:hypothetical protein [Janthinobacterium sp. PSPC3-1]